MNRDRFGNWEPAVAQARRAASKAAKRAERAGVRILAFTLEERTAPRKPLAGFRYALRGERLMRRTETEVERNTLNGRLVAPLPPHLLRMQTGDTARYLGVAVGNTLRRERKLFCREHPRPDGRPLSFRRFRRLMRALRRAEAA